MSTSQKHWAIQTARRAKAAKRAAAEQRVPGETVGIKYETAHGEWHEEVDPGTDRPETEVEDD